MPDNESEKSAADNEASPTITVTDLIARSFHLARSKYLSENRAWIDLAGALAGRSGILPLLMGVQRVGELDLVMRAMEDEFLARAAQDPFASNYQLVFAETWVVACYEALRAFKQRDEEREKLAKKDGIQPETDALSNTADFKVVFRQFELLRMPIAKYEVASERKMDGRSILMRTVGEGPHREFLYTRSDPARFHIMPTVIGPNGRIGWYATDHLNKQQQTVWIERRVLSDKVLGLVQIIEPAGLREARLKAEGAAQPSNKEA